MSTIDHAELAKLAETARLANKSQEWERGISLWRQVYSASLPAVPPSVYKGYIQALRYSGRHDEAEALAGEGLEKYPRNKSVLVEWAQNAVIRQDWPTAVERWLRVKPIMEDDALPYLRLARSLRHVGRYDEADEIALAGKEKFPEHVHLALEYANIAGAMQDWIASIARWEDILGHFGPEIDEMAQHRIQRSRAKLNPVGDIYYGARATDYVHERANTEIWQVEQDVMQGILNTLPDRLSVLDVPFGTGRFVRMYHSKNMKVTGVEISTAMLEAARADMGDEHYSRCEIYAGSAESMPYPGESFDLIVCFRFLQGIIPFAMAKTVLREMHRLIRPDGRVVAELHTRRVGTTLASPLQEHHPMGSRFSDSELAAFLDEFHFTIIDTVDIKSSVDTESKVYIMRRK